MDDTLYLERDYVRSGFQAVAKAVADTAPCQSRIFEGMWCGFLSGLRGSAFDELMRLEPDVTKGWTVERLVGCYREHWPQISLLPGVEVLLASLVADGLRIGIVTDGPSAAQRRKVEALRLSRWATLVVVTDELPGSPSKPKQDAFRAVMDGLGVSGGECVYVGDNPIKDFKGARELGWWTIRLRIPGQLHEAREAQQPDDGSNEEVRSVERLSAALRKLTMKAEA